MCSDMETFGVYLDAERNNSATQLPVDISTDHSPVRILVIQTNEELAIARDAYRVLLAARPAEALS